MEQILGILNGTLLAPKESVERLEFFSVKYKGNHCFSNKRRRGIRLPLIKFVAIVFTDQQLVEYNEQMKRAVEFIYSHPSLCRFRKDSLRGYLNTLDRLGCFYELNTDTSHRIIDKRYRVFEDLKVRSVRMIKFLKERTKPFKVKGRSVNIFGTVPELLRTIEVSNYEED